MPFLYPGDQEIVRIKQWRIDLQGRTDDAGGAATYWNSEVSASGTANRQTGAGEQFLWMGELPATVQIDSNDSSVSSPVYMNLTFDIFLDVGGIHIMLELNGDPDPETTAHGHVEFAIDTHIAAPPFPDFPLTLSITRQPVDSTAFISCTVTCTPVQTYSYFPIDLRHKAFIQSPAVCLEPAPASGASWVTPILHGDGRTFSPTSTDFRTFTGGIVTLDPAVDNPFAFGPTVTIGETQEFHGFEPDDSSRT